MYAGPGTRRRPRLDILSPNNDEKIHHVPHLRDEDSKERYRPTIGQPRHSLNRNETVGLVVS